MIVQISSLKLLKLLIYFPKIKVSIKLLNLNLFLRSAPVKLLLLLKLFCSVSGNFMRHATFGGRDYIF